MLSFLVGHLRGLVLSMIFGVGFRSSCVGTLCLFCFFISGFLAIKLTPEWMAAAGYLLRKVKRLLVPYVLWNAMYAVVTCCLVVAGLSTLQNHDVHTIGGLVDFLQDKLLSLKQLPADGPLWYVRAIFVYSCGSYLVLGLFHKLRINPRVGLIVILLVVLVFRLAGYVGNGFAYPFYSICAFLIGALLHGIDIVQRLLSGLFWLTSPLAKLPRCFFKYAYFMYAAHMMVIFVVAKMLSGVVPPVKPGLMTIAFLTIWSLAIAIPVVLARLMERARLKSIRMTIRVLNGGL